MAVKISNPHMEKVIIMCCDMGWFFVFGKILNHFIVLERDF